MLFLIQRLYSIKTDVTMWKGVIEAYLMVLYRNWYGGDDDK